MPDLTDQQHHFVLEYTNGIGAIGNASEAARRAGYSERSAGEIGRQLLEKPHVRAAVDDAFQKQISGDLTAKAIHVLARVLDDDEAPVKVRLDAAKTVLDRAGFGAKPMVAASEEKEEDPLDALSIEQLEALLAQCEKQNEIAH